MKYGRILGLVATLALVAGVVAGTATGRNEASSAPAAVNHSSHPHGGVMPASRTAGTQTTSPAANLRITLDRLLAEHALLAIEATQRGLQGGKDFPALGRALDRNSVELSQAIASVFGKQAGQKFLNGKFMWRDHIRFFVDYTVAKAGNNRAGQQRAVNNLKGYIGAFSAFLSQATGLPQSALQKGITQHVMQLKGQLDEYAAGRYAAAYTTANAAYEHMFMTGDTLSGAIVKQSPSKFGN